MLISRLHRTMRDDEAGQALVLGALVMLVLALSVFVTVQLGNGINERMRVQDAADNVAFSTAAVVARSLNFMSWVNRTMITQYVSAMAVQGMVALVDGAEAWVGMMGDTMQSLASIVCGIKRAAEICCAACGAIPIVGAGIAAAACTLAETVLAPLQTALETGAKIAWNVAKGIRAASTALDPLVGLAVQFISWLNYFGMYGAQVIMKDGTLLILSAAPVGNFQSKIMEATAGKNLNSSGVGLSYNLMMAAANGPAAYAGLFDKDSGEIPKGGTWPDGISWLDGKQRAERLMAELTNASRTGAGSMGVSWETNNGVQGSDLFGGSGVGGTIVNALTGGVKGSSRLTAPMTADRFTEEKAAAIDPGAIAQSQAAQAKCESGQADANAKGALCQAAQANCDSLSAQCAAARNAGNANDPSCADSVPACLDAASKCDAADAAGRKVDRDCQAAQAAAKGMQGQKASVGTGPNFIWSAGEDTTFMTRGGALASASHVKGGLGFVGIISGGADPKVVGVQAANDPSYRLHCRYNERDLYTVPTCPDYAYTRAIKCEQEGRHEFWGTSRYVSFDIKPDAPFGQTDYIGMVNKLPKDARFGLQDKILGFGGGKQVVTGWAGRDPFVVKAGQTQKWGTAGTAEVSNTFEGKDPGEGGPLDGLNGWARGQCYYHRPGFWAEEPNFFNPFWKARLAPVSLELGSFTSKIPGLGGALKTALDTTMVH